jgi:hypothetical protein
MAAMKWKKALIPLAVVVVLAVVAVVVYVAMHPVDTTLEFLVRDAVSKAWVYDATFKLEGREIRSYFQSDQGAVPQRFTHLKPGKAVLELSAPSYQSVSRDVVLKRGRNRLPEPIDMVGLEIPELKSFIMFEDLAGSDIQVQIRPVSKAGPAVVNHPCIDLWVGARVTVQMKGGLPVIPGAKMKPTKAPYRVVDYLVVLPNPLAINKQELESIMDSAMKLKPDAVEAYLKPYEEQKKLRVEVFTSWNVKGVAE